MPQYITLTSEVSGVASPILYSVLYLRLATCTGEISRAHLAFLGWGYHRRYLGVIGSPLFLSTTLYRCVSTKLICLILRVSLCCSTCFYGFSFPMLYLTATAEVASSYSVRAGHVSFINQWFKFMSDGPLTTRSRAFCWTTRTHWEFRWTIHVCLYVCNGPSRRPSSTTTIPP